jgi:tRNA modification GTPase
MIVDTIAAIATAPGEAGISIVRISGPEAVSIADRVFRCKGSPLSSRPAGTFVYGRVVDAEGDTLDEVVALIYRAPTSFTREDVIELQGHGGHICAKSTLRLLLNQGARAADPGEFTRRAFLNGRLDLIQAESVLSVIKAKTFRAASLAMGQLSGKLSRVMDDLYDKMLNVTADMEACLDFDQGELPEGTLISIRGELASVSKELTTLLETWDEGRVLREGVRVVIAGQPNAGKSTLLNTLLGSDRAIVTNIPGTTRDIIEEGLVIDGIPIRLMDTAGIRETDCEVEKEGIRRTVSTLEEADLILYIMDGSKPPSMVDLEYLKILEPDRSLVVLNKCDLGSISPIQDEKGQSYLTCSFKTGIGLDLFREALRQRIAKKTADGTETNILTEERHRIILTETNNHVLGALAQFSRNDDQAFVPAVSDLREALESLGKLTGRIYTDELLDTVFSRFCVGK